MLAVAMASRSDTCAAFSTLLSSTLFIRCVLRLFLALSMLSNISANGEEDVVTKSAGVASTGVAAAGVGGNNSGIPSSLGIGLGDLGEEDGEGAKSKPPE